MGAVAVVDVVVVVADDEERGNDGGGGGKEERRPSSAPSRAAWTGYNLRQSLRREPRKDCKLHIRQSAIQSVQWR